MATCCNEERSTPFCPMCGKALKDSAMLGLLEHVENMIAAWKTRIKKTEKHMELNPSEKIENRAKKQKLHLQKWESWRDAIVSAMEQLERSGEQIA